MSELVNDYKLKKTERGFSLVEFTDRYGVECSLQDSSLATEAAIWLGFGPERMHLTEGHVRALMPYLNNFLEYGTIKEPGGTI